VADETQQVRAGLQAADIRKRYPGRPKVRGEHCGIWAWRGRGVFEGKIAGRELDGVHRHNERSFPESCFPELEATQGFEFVRWAAA